MSTADKRRAFRALHQSGCFVIPNPWNVGSARYMQGLGFKALATTSSGYAHSIGYADGDVTRDMMLAHCREIAQATDIPLNADFEGGYADDPTKSRPTSGYASTPALPDCRSKISPAMKATRFTTSTWRSSA